MTTPKGATNVVPITKSKGGTLTFTAVPIDRAAMPTASKRGGRASNAPAIVEFLKTITTPGVTVEMQSPDEDKGHPVNRVTQIRKIVKEDFADSLKVETAPIESGKRYRVFVTLPTK